MFSWLWQLIFPNKMVRGLPPVSKEDKEIIVAIKEDNLMLPKDDKTKNIFLKTFSDAVYNSVSEKIKMEEELRNDPLLSTWFSNIWKTIILKIQHERNSFIVSGNDIGVSDKQYPIIIRFFNDVCEEYNLAMRGRQQSGEYFFFEIKEAKAALETLKNLEHNVPEEVRNKLSQGIYR